MKKEGRKVVCTTAYDAAFAILADKAGVDLLLVGDSMGNSILGFETTIPVTVDMMAHHTAAVARARTNALVVADVPFAVTAASFDHVLSVCSRFMQESGAGAVKIEGGEEAAQIIERLSAAGIPVVGHIGLLPQQVLKLGGYRKFGKTEQEIEQLVADAKAVEKAGAFCIVGEMLTGRAAEAVREAVDVPLIGIGSGVGCDGQIIVCTDILGLTPGGAPAFAKVYQDLGEAASQAFAAYASDVREERFPVSKSK